MRLSIECNKEKKWNYYRYYILSAERNNFNKEIIYHECWIRKVKKFI